MKLKEIQDLDKRYEVMRKTVEYALDKCETEMSNLIGTGEDEDNNNFQLVDTVDLSSKFSDLSDYLEDYSN